MLFGLTDILQVHAKIIFELLDKSTGQPGRHNRGRLCHVEARSSSSESFLTKRPSRSEIN